MIVAPGALLTVSLLLVNLLAAVVCLTQPGELAGAVLRAELLFLATNLATGYCGFSALGLITVLAEQLPIARVDLEAGQLVVEGTIQAVDYSDHAEMRAEKSGFLGKLFR